MLTSARNQFSGRVTAIQIGTVNDEIEITLAGGEQVVAVITRNSTQSLGLVIGREVVALVKSSWVILAAPDAGIRLSSRNRLEGRIKSVRPGAVNAEVEVYLKGGEVLTAIVTQGSVTQLGLEVGRPVLAYIKASHVIVGVRD